MVRLRQQHMGFKAEVAMMLLGVLAIMNLFSLIGITPNLALNQAYFTTIMSAIILITGLIGLYGFLNTSKMGLYFALLSPIFEVVIGCSVLAQIFNQSVLNIQALTSIFLGTVTFLCVYVAIPSIGLNSSSHIKYVSYPISDYAVEVEDIKKEYLLGTVVVPALNGLSLKISKGEFVALMGPSGSGKSTLLHMIGALDRPTSGRVLIDGIDISILHDADLAKLRNEKIGFVFQAYNLIARSTVLRNMELPALVKGYQREERNNRINNLLKIVRLVDKAPRKPSTMSGGEQQRVAIARALINNPSIVLADEPTGNIDSKTGSEIMGFFRKMNMEENVTVIIVTHDREVAMMADRIIYLRDGKISKEESIRSRRT